MKPFPAITSFLLADQVFRQEGVGGRPGKWCIIGVFEEVGGRSFPAIQSSFGIYLGLGNAEGTYEMQLELVDPDGATLGTIEASIESADRLSRSGVGVQLQNVPLPKPGAYVLRVSFDGRPAEDDCPFRVVLRSV